MDALNVILIVIAVIGAAFGFLSLNKAREALGKAKESEQNRQSQESKLSGLRQEVSQLKEENQRRAKMLEEARENAKRKLRKDAQKGEADASPESTNGDSETDRLKRTLNAMESQIRSMKEEAQHSGDAIKTSLEGVHKQEVAKLRAMIENLEMQVEQAKGETSKRRQNLSKQLAAPVDLTQLPTEVVGELSRLFRKTEQHEKMHGILQGKYQLAQERYQELQRRYFAVCRELALVARPDAEATDEEAQKLAESVVQASDALSAQKEPEPAKSSDTEPNAG